MFCNESLFIEVHLHNQPMKNDVVIFCFYQLALCVIYRPPDTDINLFVAIITDILSVIKAERKTCYILGDFNINLINVSNQFCQSFIPSIIILYVATRLRHNTETTLFLTSQAGSQQEKARPKRLWAILVIPSASS